MAENRTERKKRLLKKYPRWVERGPLHHPTEAEKHMRKGHSVSIEIVGNEELTICKSCKTVLVTKKIDVS